MLEKFGEQYEIYRARTPAFIPKRDSFRRPRAAVSVPEAHR